MNTLYISLIVLAVSIVVSFLYGLVSKNYSTVDRLWSLLPTLYVLIWLREYYTNPRYIFASVLVVLWAIRLTSNFAIKVGYKFSIHHGFITEDYRWEYLRKKIHNPFLFELFNLFFISVFQLGLIFLFTLPLYYYGMREGPLRSLEIVLFIVHFLLLLTETISDILQFRFYKKRNKLPWSSMKRYQLGFNTFGLWKYSRHPNYVSEWGQWLVVYLYLCTASGSLHWSGIGVVTLIALFAGSTAFTESITASKYPAYKEWQNLVSVWIPIGKTWFRWKDKKRFLEDNQDSIKMVH